MELNLKNVTLEEVITYSKQKENAKVTVLDNITTEDLEKISVIDRRLKLLYFKIPQSNFIVFLDTPNIALKLAFQLGKKAQLMYYDFARRPSQITLFCLTGHCSHWEILRDNGYIVKSYNENGKEIQQEWINTNIPAVSTDTLDKLGLAKFSAYTSIRGTGNNKCSNTTILQLSREHFINGGIYNKQRNCYYPRDTTTPRGKAEFNKLEKLFKKWGFSSLN